jgi:phage gp29-like protein
MNKYRLDTFSPGTLTYLVFVSNSRWRRRRRTGLIITLFKDFILTAYNVRQLEIQGINVNITLKLL